MPNRVPALSISSPQPNTVVGNTPFAVTGTVTAPGMPEPVDIQSVTAQVDAQAPIRATLKRLPNRNLVEVTYSASVEITGGVDPHTITVTVNSDAGFPVTRTVSVFAGLRFVAPAVLVDVALPPGSGDVTSSVHPMLANVAQQIAALPLIVQIQAANHLVVGPNILQIGSTLRCGLWIVDDNFAPQELIPPSKDFPLSQLTPDAAAGCFALAPSLNPAPALGFGFALSIPTTTLQLLLSVMLPQIISQAADNHFDVSTATLSTNDSGTVTTTLTGTLPASVPLTVSIHEVLGTALHSIPVSGGGTDASRMPAVISSSSATSVGDDLQWIFGALVPAIDLYMLTLWGIASYGAGQVKDTASGILSGLFNALPASIPFRNSLLPSDIQAANPFPMAVIDFKSFTTTDTAIVGAGTITLENRDQSMVSVTLSGADYYPNYSYGIESFYTLALAGFEPDNDQMIWQVSGAPKKSTVAIDPFFQVGGFSTGFPIPPKPAPGRYPFTISASATETCATDPTKTLTGSASMTVTANVVKGVEPEIITPSQPPIARPA